MSNPSTIWAQLSLPNPAVGSVPFVFTDGATIVTDVVNFFYTQAGLSSYAVGQVPYQLTVAGGIREAYTDTTSAPGAAIINKPAGRIKIAAGQTSVVITNNCCFTTSIVRAEIEGTFDATAKSLQVTPAAGGFTITLNAACTAAVVVSFHIINVF